MTGLKLSICQYPTTSILIDDSEHFLSQMEELLAKKRMLSRFFSDPQKALEFLNKTYQADPFTNRCISTNPDRDTDNYISHLDIRKIHHEIYNPQRFSQISVVGTDYAMPNINGLDFCRKLTDDFSLKFILTGEAGPRLAIEAFNEDAIDKFIQKGELNLPELIIKNVTELQQKYFLRLSEVALNKAMTNLYRQAPVCLSDPMFVNFFTSLVEKNRIVEFYLLDEHGSFLFLDKEATPSWLIVKTEEDMKDVYDFAHDHCPPKDIDDGLKNKTLIPYFHTEEDFEIGYNEEECRRCLHPATLLAGEQNYYYAYVTNPDAYHLQKDKILAFSCYFNAINEI